MGLLKRELIEWELSYAIDDFHTIIDNLENASDEDEAIFHTRVLVHDRVCNVIIGHKVSSNLASTEMVEKLNIPTARHPHPYRLSLCKYGEFTVTRQVLVPFTIGRYRDDILCDVVPMHACHILLGRPWKCYREVTYDVSRNKYSFVQDDRKIKLAPMTLEQILEVRFGVNKKHEKEESEKEIQEEKSSSKEIMDESLNVVKHVEDVIEELSTPLLHEDKEMIEDSIVSLVSTPIIEDSNEVEVAIENHKVDEDIVGIVEVKECCDIVVIEDHEPIMPIFKHPQPSLFQHLHIIDLGNYSYPFCQFHYKLTCVFMLKLREKKWFLNNSTYARPYIKHPPSLLPYEDVYKDDYLLEEDLYTLHDLRTNRFQEGGNDTHIGNFHEINVFIEVKVPTFGHNKFEDDKLKEIKYSRFEENNIQYLQMKYNYLKSLKCRFKYPIRIKEDNIHNIKQLEDCPFWKKTRCKMKEVLSDHSPFNMEFDSRTNLPEERGNDENIGSLILFQYV